MSVAALVVSLGAFASAFAGGWLAIRAVRYVGIVIAVGAGIRIGAAFFDLIPEAITYLGSVDEAMLWTAIGFLAFYAIEKLTTLHVGHETAAELDHDEAMHTQAEGRLKLESDLRIALSQRQFCVHYQPVVELNTRRVVSFEALLRWNHPTQGLISPYRFLEAAEDTGILISVGHWLLLQVCRQLREWEAAHPAGKSVCVTVNISARQFADGQLIRKSPQ